MSSTKPDFLEEDRKEKVYKFYNKFAKNYDKDRYASEDQKINDFLTKQIVLGFTNGIKGKKILDCGCGTGRFVEFFAKEGAEVVGSDISENMLEIAKKKVPAAAFVKADIFSLPFENKTFDIIICSQVLTHLHNYKKPLLEMKRVLKDEGIIIIDIRNILWPYRLPLLLKRIFKKSNGDYYPDYTSIWRIKGICNEIGLKVDNFRGIGFPSKKPREIEGEMKKSNSKLRYIAPTLIIKIIKTK